MSRALAASVEYLIDVINECPLRPEDVDKVNAAIADCREVMPKPGLDGDADTLASEAGKVSPPKVNNGGEQ